MTENANALTGGSIGVWAIAIIILLAMFGGGGFFGGGFNRFPPEPMFNNDSVTPKNNLEFGFYSMNNTNSKIDNLATQNAQEFFNLRQTIDGNELTRVRDELANTKMALALAEQGRYMDAQFGRINARLDNVPINPPFYPAGSLNAACVYKCPAETTTTTA